MNGSDVVRAIIEDSGTNKNRLAGALDITRQALQGSLAGGLRCDNAAVLLDALGYDLQAVPRRGTKAADGTKARPYTIDPPPRRAKLGDDQGEGKIGQS